MVALKKEGIYMSNKIMLPVILSSYRPKSDGSWSITLSTQILRKDEKAVIDSMHNQMCCIMLKDGDISTQEIEVFDSIDMETIDTKLTPSKRLYNVFWRMWEQEGKQGDFKEYYKVKMETLIEHFKQKLN